MSNQALIELRDAVKAGNRSHSLKGTPIKGYGDFYQKACNGSLDAAKELHDALLPDFEYGYDGSIAWVKVKGLRSSYRHDALNGHTARAWLIAILSALIDTP